MSTIVIIDDKEALPIRALPFITGWTLSPDVIAMAFANTDHWTTRLEGVRVYHLLPDGEYAAMLPKEWDGLEAELKVLSEKLKTTEHFDQESYPEWCKQSISILPPGCFVWKEEFEPAFNRSYSHQKIILDNERAGDRELTFTPRIPPELVSIVMEGFISDRESVDANEDAEPEKLGRRMLQHEVMLAVIAALGYEPMAIPDGGKSKVKSILLDRPRLFTESGFNHAWKEGVASGLFRLANHEKFTSN